MISADSGNRICLDCAPHMTNSNTPTCSACPLDEVKLPVIRTGINSVVACVLIAFAGGMISQQRGGVMNDGLWSMLATIPGVLVPIGIMMALPPRVAPAWSVPVLAGTMIRAMVVLTIGIAIYMLIEPSRVLFFLTMLSALMITLILDVASVISLIQKHTPVALATVDAEGIS